MHNYSTFGRSGTAAMHCFLPIRRAVQAVIVENANNGQEDLQQSRASNEEAYKFLYSQMDLYHQKVTVYGEREFSAYYPTIVGDEKAISLEPVSKENPHAGVFTLRISISPEIYQRDGWAGIYFLYPEGNWGGYPGRNLMGATKISFWARANQPIEVELTAGGVNRTNRDPALAQSDSFGPLKTGPIEIARTWKNYEISLNGQDLSSVIGAFALLTKWKRGDEHNAIYLDDIMINLPRLEAPRFLQSYVPAECDTRNAPDIANTYDQALVLLAFLARGRPDDMKRADLLARAFVQAQTHDRTYHDGRLRNAYASGELIDPHLGITRLPGRWDFHASKFLEDAYAVGSDTGNMAWAAIALVQAHALLPRRDGDPYLQAAVALANWVIKNTKVEDKLGGFAAGYEGFEEVTGTPDGQEKLIYRSTEHNIDLVALFELVAEHFRHDNQRRQLWTAQAAHARQFVEAMWQQSTNGAYLATGTSEGDKITTNPISLDAQTWSVLGMGEPRAYERSLDWALKNCTAGKVLNAFDFNCLDGDGAWWEGTAQVAAALKWLDRTNEAVTVLAGLREAQVRTPGPAKGAIPAASVCGLTTGFYRDWGPKGKKEVLPWTFTNAPHIGATAWYVLATQGKNPFQLN